MFFSVEINHPSEQKLARSLLANPRQVQLVERSYGGGQESKLYRVYKPQGCCEILMVNGMIIQIKFQMHQPFRDQYSQMLHNLGVVSDPPPKPKPPKWLKVVPFLHGSIEDKAGPITAKYFNKATGESYTLVHSATWDAVWSGDETGARLFISNVQIDGGLQDVALRVAVEGMLNGLARKEGF